MGSESLSHDYEELSLLFEEAGVDTTAAEAHGIITGVLGVPTQSQLDWLPLILGTQPLIANAAADELPERLQTLWREVAGMLRQGEFEFALLLPDQQQRLEERAEALANWCRGYLLGLAQAGARGAQDLSADATEIVGDMMHIARGGRRQSGPGITESGAKLAAALALRRGRGFRSPTTAGDITVRGNQAPYNKADGFRTYLAS